MNKLFMLFAVLGIILLFTSCVEKNGYYEPGGKNIINNLTKDKSWVYITEETESYILKEIYTLKDNGSGNKKFIKVFQNGTEEDGPVISFHWAFTKPNFGVLYMDDGVYWTIEKLTPEQLCVYETTRDPITVIGQRKTYMELKAKKTN